ncbi:hypothetical protein FRC11_006212 [Ceratobasidium sp. 423]|nr:hypothetical protein FRC11_006212 [Ceratobasidium sp. 423]
MYVEEASEQDIELADVQNKNLDLMLLFVSSTIYSVQILNDYRHEHCQAALFSAILTAFLIESTKMLQQDPADTSAALLLFIAQSQRRMELGTPAQTLDIIDTAAFSPTLASRFINGLWFTALALSLSAALIAMLAKEWLAAYLANSVRPAYDRALARQTRYDGLITWKALPIISFLPTLLHLSLLLFSLGLVVYLWNLDTGIAVVVPVIIGLTLGFYTVTLFLGALLEPCPFVTQLSKYIRTGFKAYFKNWAPWPIKVLEEMIVSHSSIKQTESQALAWLIKNSHDPAVVDCAFQAVASHIGLNTTQENEFHEVILTTTRGSPQQTHPISSNNIIFFACICNRLSELIRQGPKAGFVDQGLNIAIARYALALPKLLGHIIKSFEVEIAAQCIQHATEANICPDSGDSNPLNLASAALKDIDAAFGQQWGPMSADVYALLSASHLELTDIVARTLRVHTPPPSRPRSRMGARTSDRPHTNAVIGPSATAISLLRPSRRENLVRSSRLALTRSSSQLHHHLNSQAQISDAHLAYLLKAVSKVMTCTQLRTRVRQNVDMVGADSEAFDDDRVELSLRLTETILKMLQDTQISQVPDFYRTANQVLASAASLYVTQKPENLTAEYWANLLQADGFVDDPPTGADILPLSSTADPNQIPVIRQILVLSALPFTTYNCLPVTALGIFYEQIKGAPAWFNLWGALQHGQLVEQWINQAYKLQFDCPADKSGALTEKAQSSTIGIIGLILRSDLEQLPVRWLDIPWDKCIVPLLNLISSTPYQYWEVGAIFEYIADQSNPAFESMIKFLRSSKGFSTLHSIRMLAEYRYVTSHLIIALIDSHRLQVSEDNVGAMLDEVASILEECTSISNDVVGTLSNLTGGVLYCLEEAHHRGVTLPWDHRFITEIKILLQNSVLNGSGELLGRLEAMMGDSLLLNEEFREGGF